jgi:uncharacterized damage-inducible protein DinB
MLEAMNRLLRHMEWANRLLIAHMRENEPPADASRLFNHVLGATRLWYLRLQEEDWTVMKVWPTFTLDECESLADLNARTYLELVEQMAESDLARSITYTNSQGRVFTNAVGDILLHVTTHATYHRGQIAAALRRAGQAPPSTDYIVFVR